MNCQIILVFSVICVQGLLAVPNTASANAAGPLTENEKTWLTAEFQNIKEKGETFRNSMQQYVTLLPGLKEMVDAFLKGGRKQAKAFANFNKNLTSGQISEQEAEEQYRKFFNALKNLEESFQSQMKEKYGPIAENYVKGQQVQE